MKFLDLVRELKSLNLPSNQFVVTSSGVLAMHNIREANDFDLVVSDQLWEKLTKKYDVIQDKNREKIKLTNNIEVLGRVFIKKTDPFPFRKLLDTAEVFDGVNFVKLEYVKAYKMIWQRKKDLNDIDLINNYLTKLK